MFEYQHVFYIKTMDGLSHQMGGPEPDDDLGCGIHPRNSNTKCGPPNDSSVDL